MVPKDFQSASQSDRDTCTPRERGGLSDRVICVPVWRIHSPEPNPSRCKLKFANCCLQSPQTPPLHHLLQWTLHIHSGRINGVSARDHQNKVIWSASLAASETTTMGSSRRGIWCPGSPLVCRVSECIRWGSGSRPHSPLITWFYLSCDSWRQINCAFRSRAAQEQRPEHQHYLRVSESGD